ncbi:xylulokinase [Virgibacillus senegalensis]|uniref:xylulokinase n=1 Tax=Virgibacillus senegalensis TaxID=1499679 RepID=UPI00069FFD19|nr:xylulokinase [Virgibacillus senegalensis]
MDDKHFLMAIDIGTTSVKCLVMNAEGVTLTSSSHGYQIINRHPSWVEQCPDDWCNAVIRSIKNCLIDIDSKDIKAISFSGHMSALVMVDEEGEPLYPSILITDTRSSKQTSFLRERYLERVSKVTGNEPLDAFTLSKLLWVKEEYPDLLGRTSKFLFPKDYVRYKITGLMGTDPTDAGNSLLYDIKKKDWNWEFINELDIPESIFPAISNTTAIFGQVSKKAASLTGLKEGTPVVTGGADMACSQVGTGAILEGVMAITLSTSGQVVMAVPGPHEYGIGKVTFHPAVNTESMYTMGTIFTGGLGVEWGYKLLFNKERLDKTDYKELGILTKEMEGCSPGSEGLLFLPFLVGSSTPHFDTTDRASWVGLSLNQDKALLLHSILEGITFNILENVNVVKKIAGNAHKVHIGAGGSRNRVWCQMIADVLGMDICTLSNRDGSALGAAIIAGTGIGLFSSIEDAASKIVTIKDDIPFNTERHKTYHSLFEGYQEVYHSMNRYMHKYLSSPKNH